MFHPSFWFILTVILITWPFAVRGQPFCMKHSDFVAKVAEEYQETLVGFGLLSDNKIFEVFASSEGVTFTIIFTTPEGLACPIGSGQGWRNVFVPPKGMKTVYPG